MENFAITLENDLSFDNNGFLSISKEDKSFAERLKFDLESNSNWVFKDTLGCHWVLEDGTGMLQQKGIESFIEGYLNIKISSYEEVLSITSIDIDVDHTTRKANINIILVTTKNEELELEVNV